MKLKKVAFKNAVTVLQIFRNIYEYGKDQKSFDSRKQLAQWGPIHSVSGYVNNNELYLPESVLNEANFGNCTLLTIEDNSNAFHHTLPGIYTPKNNQCFQQARHIKLDIFKLEIGPEIDMHLEYGLFEVGIPERANFKLCTLQPHQPVEIKINGKTESSLTGRRQRNFKEQHYIYEHMGVFEYCYLLKQPAPPVIKTIPAYSQTINLLKPLW